MPVESVLTLAAGLAEGLGAVHAAGVVHRDLKPSNVLLASDGPRIIDFGISRAMDSAWLTNAGSVVVGSPGFMSPEQAEGRPVGPATDIFSLGSVLAYAATGEPPFGAGSASALLYRVVYGTAATGYVPAPLRRLIEHCLAKDPADRPSADELLTELGYAEPSGDWLSWSARIPRLAEAVPATQLDPAPHRDASDHKNLAGNGVVLTSSSPSDRGRLDSGKPTVGDLVPGISAAGISAPGNPDGSRPATAVESVMAPRPARHSPSSALIGAAVAAVLAAGAAGAVAYVVASHHDQGSLHADSAPPGAQISTDNRARPATAGQPQVTPPGPRAVVDSYFAAINQRDWPQVWRLGGENSNSSYREMVDGYSGTDRDVVRAIRVSGDHAVVRVRAYEADGAFQVYQMYFVIRDGVILHATQQLLTTEPSGGAT